MASEFDKHQLLDMVYMNIAYRHAGMSKAVRRKVGAVIVTPHQVMLGGWNGTPPGWDNCCEDDVGGRLVTKSSVIHAEVNCMLKAAKEGVSVVGSTLYVTLEPCLACAAMISAAGIKRVVYSEYYESQSHGSGVQELKKAGVKVSMI